VNHIEYFNMMAVFKLKVNRHVLISLYKLYSHTCLFAGKHYEALYKQLYVDVCGRLENYIFVFVCVCVFVFD
jgi:hypothetical protein